MKKQEINFGVDRRSADRVNDNSLLVVAGRIVGGEPFSELTLINDVSTGGISFCLSTPLGVGDLVDLSIYSEKWTSTEAVPRYQIKARVLRVLPNRHSKNQFLIAAELASNFVNLGSEEDFESVVRHLQQAVAYDESQRQQYE
jgi:hypothetical protein